MKVDYFCFTIVNNLYLLIVSCSNILLMLVGAFYYANHFGIKITNNCYLSVCHNNYGNNRILIFKKK